MRVLSGSTALGLLWAAAALGCLAPRPRPHADLAGDYELFCRFVAEEYAYLDQKQTRWSEVAEAHRAEAGAARDRSALLAVLESALGELYDFHAHLGSSSRTSRRLVPTDADLWAAWEGEAAVVEEVREGSGAAKAGLERGVRVLAVDGQPIAAAAARYRPRHLSAPDPEADSFALQAALAGRQDGKPIRLSIAREGRREEIAYAPGRAGGGAALSLRRLEGGVGYVRLHNSLGDEQTVRAFDEALAALGATRGLVLDLRDTPSGGNSTVARGIMGRLVGAEAPYQVHELAAEERRTGIRRRWVELVLPRGATYAAPVVVLVGRWTGSMGEGLAIGLDAARGSPVVGTPMARLRGALGELRLPASGLVVRIPTERLFHVNGTPREAFLPLPSRVGLPGPFPEDPALQTALALLAERGR